MKMRISTALVIAALSAVLVVNAFGGAARYFLDSIGMGVLIYTPSLFIVLSVLVVMGKMLSRGVVPVKVMALWLFIGFSTFVGIIQVSSFSQVMFGLYVLLPFIFGFLCADFILQDIEFVKRLMLVLWMFSVLGLFLDSAFEVPWRGFGYKVGEFAIEGNRDWETFGVRRLSGFSRASFDVAAVLLVSSIFSMFCLKKGILKVGLWCATGYAVYLTTSKGILLSLIVLSFGYMLFVARLYLANSLLLGAIIVLAVGMPLAASIYAGGGVAGGFEGDVFLQSLGERFTQMWPDAFEHVKLDGNTLLGVGVGGIGVPLDQFNSSFINSADNVFVYLYCLGGVFSLPIMVYMYLTGRKSVLRARRGDRDAFLVYQLIVGVLIYGITANIFESAVLGWCLGLCLGRSSMSIIQK